MAQLTVPFIWGSNGQQLSAADVARQRAIAASLMQANAETPQNVGQGLNAIGRALAINALNGRADAAQQAGQSGYNDLFNALGDNPSRAQLIALEGNGWGNEGQQSVVDALLKQNLEASDPATQLDLELKRAQLAKAQREASGKASGPDEFYAPVVGTIDGKPAYVQFGHSGSVKQADVPNGFVPQSRYEKIDLGDSWLIKDTTTGQSETVPKNLAAAAQQTAEGKGQGEKNVALPEVKAADTGALQQFDQQVSQVVAPEVDKVIAAIDADPNFTTGTLGQWLSGVGGVKAHDVAESLKTIGANVGFGELQQMRDNSKTGGALGSISDSEGALLRAVKGSLEQGQTKDQLKANLQRVKTLYQQVLSEKKAAFAKKYGGANDMPHPQSVDDWVTEVLSGG